MRKEYYKGIVIYLFDTYIMIDKKAVMLTDIDLIQKFAQSNNLKFDEFKKFYNIAGNRNDMFNFIKDLSFQADVICR